MTKGFLAWAMSSLSTTGNALGLGGKMISSSVAMRSLKSLSLRDVQ